MSVCRIEHEQNESRCISEKATNDSNSPIDKQSNEQEVSIELHIISFISSFLLDIIIENKEKGKRRKMDCFCSRKIPKISIEEFLIRVVKYSKIELSTLICVFIYIMRMVLKQHIALCLNNVYRIILAGVVVGIKYNEDNKFNNSYYAKIGGISLEELNQLEYYFYYLIGFDLFVSEEEYCDTLEKIII